MTGACSVSATYLNFACCLQNAQRGRASADTFDEKEFELFCQELRAEMAVNAGDIEPVSEEEARELFLMMKDEYQEVMSMSPESLAAALGVDDLSDLDTDEFDGTGPTENVDSLDTSSGEPANDDAGEMKSRAFSSTEYTKDDWNSHRAQDFNVGFDRLESDLNKVEEFRNVTAKASTAQTMVLDDSFFSELGFTSSSTQEKTSLRALAPNGMSVLGDAFVSESVELFDDNDELEVEEESVDAELEELRRYLPSFSERRLRRIQKVFHKTLGDPSMLDLVPLVRERMPDYITATWLKQANALTARYVVQKASEDGLVDVHMLNGALELETLSGSLDRALELYHSEFERQQIAPNEYSHRLILQMFVQNGRLPRALAFKDSLVEQGQTPDILSYGSLIEYCGRHQQLGSAVMLLKECLAVHGAPPGEASLTPLRRLCRSSEKLSDMLVAMVGPDPSEWVRHGEAHLKREMSKKGRRDVQMARNRLVHL